MSAPLALCPQMGQAALLFVGPLPARPTPEGSAVMGLGRQAGSCVLSPQKGLQKFQNPPRDLTLNKHRAAAAATPISAHGVFLLLSHNATNPEDFHKRFINSSESPIEFSSIIQIQASGIALPTLG